MKTKPAARKLAVPAVAMLAALAVLNVHGRPIPRSAPPAAGRTELAVATRPANASAAADVAGETVAPMPAPSPAPANVPAAAAGPAANSNLALEQHTQGKIIEKFRADHLDLKTALALFASQNDLNIVPDNDVEGTVTLDVHNLPLDQMMRALLEAGDCTWQEDHGLIRVRNTETHTFDVDYLRLKRNGLGNSSATLDSATANNGNGGLGGSGGGGGGGGGNGANGSGSGSSWSSSSVNLIANNDTDFWTELEKELQSLLSDDGRKSLAINRMAGIIEITDRPSVLKKVEHYLNSTEERINRQVDIEAQIYDVSLNNQFQYGIDWNVVAQYYTMSSGYGGIQAVGATVPTAIGSGQLKENTFAMLLTNVAFLNNGHQINSAAAVTALKTQGNVEVLAKPRIRALNNQTALIKVGTEEPFFSENTFINQSQSGNITSSGAIITTVTVGTILSITPQISEDSWISMDITPVLTSLVAERAFSGVNTRATAPVLDTKQASTLVRVRDDTTVVLGGLIQTERAKNDNKIPVLSDIPFLGKALFTGTFNNRLKKELVIFLTPHIVNGNEPSVVRPEVNYETPLEQRAHAMKHP